MIDGIAPCPVCGSTTFLAQDNCTRWPCGRNGGNAAAEAKARTAAPILGLRAAVRDASWYRNPNTSGAASKYHALVVSENQDTKTGIAGCSVFTYNQHMGIDQTVAAGDIAADTRCMRPGCKKLWQQYDEERKAWPGNRC